MDPGSHRYLAAAHRATGDGDLGYGRGSGKVALEKAGVDPKEIDAILVCTVTPDMMFPSTACLVQHRLG